MAPRIPKAVMDVSNARVREPGNGFVGRRQQVAQLDAAVADAAHGRGTLVAVVGEAGIGKTRLVQEALRRAADHGVLVAWSACVQDGHAPGFWPWTQVVSGVLAAAPEVEDHLGAARRLSELAPASTAGPGDKPIERLATEPARTTTDPELARYALFDAVISLLRRATTSRPLMLVIDDVQWADTSSLSLLGYVGRHLATLPVVVAVTCRPDEADGVEIRRLLADLLARAMRIDLQGMDESELADLLEGVEDPAKGRIELAALHQRTGGNPLFALEISRDAGIGPGGAGGRQLPETVQALIGRRVQQVAPQTRELLDMAAVFGLGFRPDLLAAAAGSRPLELLEPLDEAITRGFVRESGPGRYEFVHALVRDALYEGLGMATRVRLHERIADALAALADAGSPVDPAQIAHHYTGAAPAGRAGDAIAFRRAAGRAAMIMLAYEEAVRQYGDAINVLDSHPMVAERAAVLLEFGAAQLAAGDVEGARRTHLAAADAARASGDGEQLAAAALGLGGGPVGFEVTLFDREQVALLEEALKVLPDDSPTRALVLARLSVALSLDAPVTRRAELSSEAVTLARTLGERSVLAAALAAHCDAIAGPADSEARLAAATEIVALAAELGDVRLELLGRRLAIVAMLEVGDIGGADTQIGAFERLVGGLRQPLFSWYVPLWRGMQALVAGRLDEAQRWLDQAKSDGERAGSRNSEILCSTQQWWLLIEAARFDEQVNLLDDLGRHPAWTTFGYEVTHALSEAVAGHVVAARNRLAALGVAALAELPVDSEWMPFMAGFATIAGRTGARAEAEWIYPRLLPHRDRFVVDGIGAHCFGSAERFLGLLAGALGRPDSARAHFEAAVTVNESTGQPLAAAATLRDAALSLQDSQYYQRAIAAYRALGLDTQVADLMSRLEIAGGQAAAAEVVPAEGEFVCEGEYWRLTWAGETVHVKDSKGMHDLALVLAEPGREVPALDLTGAPSGGDLGEVVDARARAAYRARLTELDEEIEDADRIGDGERSSRAIAEKDALIEQLTAAYGLGGRARKAGDPGEKARSAVSWRIRHAIQRITDAYPDLGKHLKNSVRTGRFVGYNPERPVSWTTRR